ncbi:hypothetical protein ABTE52_22415, partial [Acinetobacter baumannii]
GRPLATPGGREAHAPALGPAPPRDALWRPRDSAVELRQQTWQYSASGAIGPQARQTSPSHARSCTETACCHLA